MWIARDYNGNLHIFDRKPWRENLAFREPPCYWSNNSQATLVKDTGIRRKFFDLKWEDEPIEIDIVVKQ